VDITGMSKLATPIAPKVSLSVWKELYAAAEQFKTAEPWNLLDDLDLICVRNPATGETGFGIVMGSLGTLFGFCLYRGAEGFDIYRKMVDEERSIDSDDILSMQNCLKVDFCSREEMEREDVAVMKQLGLAFRGKFEWPQFRSLLPRYAPWFLTESEAALLTLGLKAAYVHYRNIDTGVFDDSLREDEFLMYTPVNDEQTEFTTTWEPLPVFTKAPLLPPVINLPVLSELKSKTLAQDTAWECNVIMLPSPIFEGERPFFMRMPALCHAITGIAFKTDVAAPDITDQQLLADTLCSAIKFQGVKPHTLFVKSKEMKDALMPLAGALGIQLKEKKTLPAVDNLKETLLGFMMKGKI
jgi:hypothetical protein